MNLWEDHQRRRHIFGDWTAVNIIAWVVICIMLFLLIGGAMWLASLADWPLPNGCKV